MRSKTFVRAVFVPAVAWATFALVPPVQAQQTGTISGTVTEAGTTRPLAGAEVSILGVGPAGLGVVRTRTASHTSDASGRYTLTNVPAGPLRVRVRLVGYSSQSATLQLVAGQTAEANFALSPSVIALDEIVVTGAGVAQSKKQLGNTIATVNAEQLAKTAPTRTVSELLAAREPGVNVNVSSGLGGSAVIEIRGVSSLSMGNSPVVYLDGVRMDNNIGFRGMNGGGSNADATRPLDNLNPGAIERIEVLKGAAAATLYGSEANSGVIQIFTKKGSAGRPRFNFRVDQGISNVDEGRLKLNSGFARNATQLQNMKDVHGVAASTQIYDVVEVPVLRDAFGTGHNYAFSGDVSGGSEDFQYFIASRWARDDGPFDIKTLDMPGEADVYRRIQGSAQFTLFPRDRLSFRLSTQFTDLGQRTPANDNNIYAPTTLPAFAKPERAYCNAPATGGGDGSCRLPDGSIGPGNVGNVSFSTIREALTRSRGSDMEHFNTSSTVTYQAAPSLNVDVTFGLDVTNQNNFDLRPFGNDVDDFTNVRDLGEKSAFRANNRELTFDARGTWTERFGSLSSQLVVGGQGFISRNRFVRATGQNFPGPGLEVTGAGANPSTFESFSEQVNVGLLFQEQIGVNDWIYLTGGGRWDRNSAFGDSTSGAFYPKVSASIIPSDLPSWGSGTISSLRLRAAFGKSGQQPGAFDRFTTFGPLASSQGPGIAPVNLGNPELKPEVSREIEMGGEIGFFNDRVSADVTHWRRSTVDALVDKQFAVSGGFLNRQLANIGELRAHGWEIKGNALVVDTDHLSIDLFANGAFLREFVYSLGGASPIKTGGSYPRYRNFIVGPDTLYNGEVVYYQPGAHLGAALLPNCDTNPVYLGNTAKAGVLSGTPRPCWTPGSTVPFDSNGDGQPDTEAEFRAFLQANINNLTLDNAAFNPMYDDADGDGDVLDNYKGNSAPDWTGSFGTNITLMRNLTISTLFEYKTGNFYVNNLTDGFRNANPSIGRNTPIAARVEATIENPAASIDDKLDAAIIWATQLKALSPYDGLNEIQKASFLRWRELGVTYTAPASWTGALGLEHVSLNVSGRNLMIWTPYDGVDPELNGSTGDSFGTSFFRGLETFGVPIQRRYTFSVQFGF